MSLFSTAGLARVSSRHPWRVLGIWLVILVLGGFSASTIGSVTTTDFAILNDPEATQGLELMEERMGRDDPLTESVVVTSTDTTVDDPAFRQVVVDTTANIRGLEGIVDPNSVVNYYELQESADPERRRRSRRVGLRRPEDDAHPRHLHGRPRRGG